MGKITVGKFRLQAAVITALLLLLPLTALAHGVEIEYTERCAVEITARYDSGDLMAGAQVAVFAPGNPAEPWLTGTCDDSGKFYFVPDPQMPGLWEVQVRLAGHGDLVRIEVGEGEIAPAVTGGFTTAQKLLMAAAVIWGLAGTALYFSRRRA